MWPWRLFGRRRGFFVGHVHASLVFRHGEAGVLVAEKEANSGNND